jgi:hypothetical protein
MEKAGAGITCSKPGNSGLVGYQNLPCQGFVDHGCKESFS